MDHLPWILLSIACAGLGAMAAVGAAWLCRPLTAWTAGLVAVANLAVAGGHIVALFERAAGA